MILLHLVCLLFSVANIHAQKTPNTVKGRNGIVHLFEWKFKDIAAECECFLGPKGFAAVQVSPVHENLVILDPIRPWWERYQVVSYKIISRSGNEIDFRDMVSRCNKVGVRIYVDVVFNHMTACHPNATGVGGTTADPCNFLYPGVPYGPGDFNQPTCEVWNWQDRINVRNCRLLGLNDLNQGTDYVRGKIIKFLNHLIDIGVAGFRIDAAKHMWPGDLRIIYNQLNDLNPAHCFAPGTRPFIYQQVIDLGREAVRATEYTDLGRVTEFKYGAELSNAFRGNNPIRFLQNFGQPWGFVPHGDAVVFVDNHDTQRGFILDNILNYREHKLYKMAVAFMLAFPYGYPRVISSFFFDDTDQGPPNVNGNILSPTINPDGTCGNGWVCEHRWREIVNMVDFSNVVAGTSVKKWWNNGDYQIAFCRGEKGFIAFNAENNTNLNATLQTCLPAGTYCDVISGSKSYGFCTGKTVYVGCDGTADIVISHNEENGVLAIHAESKL